MFGSIQYPTFLLGTSPDAPAGNPRLTQRWQVELSRRQFCHPYSCNFCDQAYVAVESRGGSHE
jgi:hypothetical protein